MKTISNLRQWFGSLYRVWCHEFWMVRHNLGVLIFFLALPTLYPVVYTLIYNPEVVREIPVVAVDRSGSVESRNFLRTVNQTEAIDIIGYAVNLQEARQAMNRHHCYGIIEVPEDFGRDLNRGEQAVVPFYCDMSLLLRYRQMLFALTDVQIATGERLALQKIEQAGAAGAIVEPLTTSVNTESFFLGDTTQGFASFIMPGILVLILQQSMLLGITMLAGGAAERRRRNNGLDPMEVNAPATATVWGKTLCYVVIYIPLVLYALWFVPWMFYLPRAGALGDALLLMLPMLFATAMLGQSLGVFMTEREMPFLLIVFTSVVFLFLSGLTWPRYAMGPVWRTVSDCIPATWGVEGFVRIISNGGSLSQQATALKMLWLLTGVYFLTAWVVVRAYRRRP